MKKIILILVALIGLIGSVNAEATVVKETSQKTYGISDTIDKKWYAYSSNLDLMYEVKAWELGFAELVARLGNNYKMLENNTLLDKDVIIMLASFEKKFGTRHAIAFTYVKEGNYVVANWKSSDGNGYTTLFWEK